MRWLELAARMKEKKTVASDLMIEVDEDGFADFSDLAEWWDKYRDLLAQKADVEAKLTAVKTRLGDRMRKAGASGFKIRGVPVVSYRKDATFPVAEYTKKNPHVAAVYSKLQPVFDLELFKRDRPDEYAEWRGHSFKLIKTS